MSAIKDSLNQAFDVELTEEITEDTSDFTSIPAFQANVPATKGKTEQSIVPFRSNEDEDFEFARANLKDLAQKGKQLLDKAIENAESSDHPRHFEVAGQILKAVADINKDILISRKLHKDVKEPNKDEKPTVQHINVNSDKTVFVGTTAQLLDAVENAERQQPRPLKVISNE
jgi:hypothetical protein